MKQVVHKASQPRLQPSCPTTCGGTISTMLPFWKCIRTGQLAVAPIQSCLMWTGNFADRQCTKSLWKSLPKTPFSSWEGLFWEVQHLPGEQGMMAEKQDSILHRLDEGEKKKKDAPGPGKTKSNYCVIEQWQYTSVTAKNISPRTVTLICSRLIYSLGFINIFYEVKGQTDSSCFPSIVCSWSVTQ